ncbi:hypothetical protein ORN01_25320 [Bacillus cereus]|uniref:hypothetical protein n=1 Tax=Bacillus cereus group TaxID=86661 RepID=UPI0022E9763D|nr:MULTISPECIES: hypothetical protein [Bacillus cereus group]MDA1509603.1 hypothetical protein [Bacillus cereus group sp. TH36-2LC]MDZ4632280.1 hypothetical protein [Bacillus cereus]
MTIEKLAFEVKGLQVANEKAVTISQMRRISNVRRNLLATINSAFESGYWTGGTYDLLHALKVDLVNIEKDLQYKAMRTMNA